MIEPIAPTAESDRSGPAPAAPAGGETSYDAVPYSVGAFPQTRPDRLATVATLFGMNPAPPSNCRVLELGCAAGGNLIPMALSDPGSRFVGIDLSARQIGDARATADALGVRNVDLRAMSILGVGDDFGTFDYILCHGVYSWVPPEVQDKILEVCRNHLAPHGVAYVSYNCYPGWHARSAIREMLWYHTERFGDPAVRVSAARGLLAFLVKFSPGDGGYEKLIHQELALLLATPDTYLLHEHLEEYNEPLYFHQFARRAAAKGLQYLAEAHVGSMVAAKFGREGEQILRQISPDLLHMEQYMDFLRNRMFRQTLLCRADVRLDHALRPEAVAGFFVGSAARPVASAAGDAAAAASGDGPAAAAGGAEHYRAEGGPTLATSDPLMKAAMRRLAEVYPATVRFDELFAAARSRAGAPGDDTGAARQLAARLLNCYLSGLVEFFVSPPRFVREVSRRPVASAYARLRAREGGKVVNVRLETVTLSPPSRLVLEHLDGTRDRAALAELVAEWLRQAAASRSADTLELPGRPTPGAAAPGAAAPLPASEPRTRPEVRASAYVDALLECFARAALLVE